MKPRVTLLTLGVDDLERAVRFYRDGLGKSLAHDSGLRLGARNPTDFSIGHNVASKREVDDAMDRAKRAGASLVKPAHDTFWGGYAGYFQDPDGHLWEVAWNPQWTAPA